MVITVQILVRHQTGWTGLVARLIQIFTEDRSEQILSEGTKMIIKREE